MQHSPHHICASVSADLCYIPGGPEITEQSIQSIFQDFALINTYFLHLVE